MTMGRLHQAIETAGRYGNRSRKSSQKGEELFRRIAGLSVIILALLPASPARAELFSGACLLDMELSLPAASSLTSVTGYSISIVSGTCATDRIDQIIQTTGGGGGSGITEALCGNGAGVGGWTQYWSGLPTVTGTHVLTGANGSWKIVLTNVVAIPNFQSVIYATPQPLDLDSATGSVSCALGTSKTVRLLGVQVFEDPSLP